MFGLGTMKMQVIAGMFFGRWLIRKKKLGQFGIAYDARGGSHSVLSYGNIAFVIAGIIAVEYPAI